MICEEEVVDLRIPDRGKEEGIRYRNRLIFYSPSHKEYYVAPI